MLSRAAFLLSTAMIGSTAQAAVSMYGIEIGSPLNIKECPKSKIAFKWEYQSSTELCAQDASPSEMPADFKYSARIVFPAGKMPSGIAGRWVSATIIDGVVQGLIAWTGGYSTQDIVYRQLQEKFGPPVTSSRQPLASGSGAIMGGIVASWSINGGIEVNFTGVIGAIDQGMIHLGTLKGIAAYFERVDKAIQRTPM